MEKEIKKNEWVKCALISQMELRRFCVTTASEITKAVDVLPTAQAIEEYVITGELPTRESAV
jgi:hypothetical protein